MISNPSCIIQSKFSNINYRSFINLSRNFSEDNNILKITQFNGCNL